MSERKKVPGKKKEEFFSIGRCLRRVGINLCWVVGRCDQDLSIADQKATRSTRCESENLANLLRVKKLAESGVLGAQVMNDFIKYTSDFGGEKVRVLSKIRYISDQNRWLKNEIRTFHDKLISVEKTYLEAAAEKMYFQIFFKMRNRSHELRKDSSVLLKKFDSDADPGRQDDDDDNEDNSDPEDEAPTNLSAMFLVVRLFISERKFVVASAWCNKSVTDFSKKFGAESIEVGAVHLLLGRVYKHSEELELAKNHFEVSLGIMERILGRASDKVGIILTLLGSTLGKLGQFENALKRFRRALEIREKIHDRNSEVAHLYKKIGELYIALKRWKESIPNLNVSLTVFETLYDPTECVVIKTLTSLTRAYLETNATELAYECLLKVNLAYVRKNNPGSFTKTSPILAIKDFLKRDIQRFPPEILDQSFGSVSSTLNTEVVELMIMYFDQIQRHGIAEVLQGWIDLSIKNMNVPEDVMVAEMKLIRNLSIDNLNQYPQIGKKSSGRLSVKASTLNMFADKSLLL